MTFEKRGLKAICWSFEQTFWVNSGKESKQRSHKNQYSTAPVHVFFIFRLTFNSWNFFLPHHACASRVCTKTFSPSQRAATWDNCWSLNSITVRSGPTNQPVVGERCGVAARCAYLRLLFGCAVIIFFVFSVFWFSSSFFFMSWIEYRAEKLRHVKELIWCNTSCMNSRKTTQNMNFCQNGVLTFWLYYNHEQEKKKSNMRPLCVRAAPVSFLLFPFQVANETWVHKLQ